MTDDRELEELRAENARLRGALAEIASFCKLPHENDFDCPSTVAARALAGECDPDWPPRREG